MTTKITFIIVLLLSTFSSMAQVPAVLIHDDLADGVQYDEGVDMEIYNNSMYFTIMSAGKIVKVDITAPNNPVVDVVTGLTNPTGITRVGNELYFLQGADALFSPSSGKISKIDPSLSNPPIVDMYTGLMYPLGLVVNGTNIYVSEAYLDGSFELDHMEMSLVNLAGTPSKTVLHNQFLSIDDFELKDNFLYIIEWDEVQDLTRILKLDVATGTPTVPVLYYNDSAGDFFFKGAIKDNYMYLNNDTSPTMVKRIDLNSASPTAEASVDSFEFNGNSNINIDEIVVDNSNNLYVFGEYFDSVNTTYLLYKADMNSLGITDFDNTQKIKLYPNPSSEQISFANLKSPSKYEIYSLEGRLVKKGTVSQNETIVVSQLTSGVYTITLNNIPFKFIKE